MKEFTTFKALLKPLSKNLIQEAISRYAADDYYKQFKTQDHLLVMIYAQLQAIKSLRDLEIACNSQKEFKLSLNSTKVARSTLSDANAHRSADIFLWMAKQLMVHLSRKVRKEVDKVVKIFDSTSIPLKGKGYDEWTSSHRTSRCQGLKVHMEYDSEWAMPTHYQISHANVDDGKIGQCFPVMSDTIYVFDRGYYDFNWWWTLHEQGAFFVTRLKSNAAINIQKHLAITQANILEDSLFTFKNTHPRGGKQNVYTQPLRRIVIKREGKDKPLVLVTNLLELSAGTLAELYKARWDIELFFKWIKQNLKIKTFLGKSENAVKVQIAIALIVYLLLGIFKSRLNVPGSLHQLLIWVRYNLQLKKKIYSRFKITTYYFKRLDFKTYQQSVQL